MWPATKERVKGRKTCMGLERREKKAIIIKGWCCSQRGGSSTAWRRWSPWSTLGSLKLCFSVLCTVLSEVCLEGEKKTKKQVNSAEIKPDVFSLLVKHTAFPCEVPPQSIPTQTTTTASAKVWLQKLSVIFCFWNFRISYKSLLFLCFTNFIIMYANILQYNIFPS